MATSDSTPNIPQGYKRCTKCGEIKPATTEYFHWRNDKGNLNRRCRICKREDDRHWRQNNLEKARASVKHWRQVNPEKSRKGSQRWRRAHPETFRQSAKHYRQANPEKGREYQRYYQACKRSLPATFTEQHWIKALEYFHGCCAYCGNPPSLFDYNTILHHEHHIAQSKGGGYTPDNIVPACQFCNLSKHDNDPQLWLIKRFGKRKAKNILSQIEVYFETVKHTKD